MSPATLNKRISESYEDFPIHVEESVAVDDHEDARQIGELITGEIEADAVETAELRAARERMRTGDVRTQADVERD